MGWASVGVGVWLGIATPAQAADPLPEGDEGIAAAYPGDEGIEGDPAVIFADDFEGYADPEDLSANWNAAVHHIDHLRLATEADDVYAGQQSLEMTVPQQEDELSNAAARQVSPELDQLFLRYYSKFRPPFDVVGSSHNGASISAHYYIDGQATPGIPADGTNKFLAALENWRGEPEVASPGLLNIYLYHPEQRSQWGDHLFPTGVVLPNSSEPFDFGEDFEPRPDIIPELDRWYCWEYMVQANTPGQNDGRIAIWLDGVLAADFVNLRLRDVDTLTIDRFTLSFHIGSNTAGEARKWYDNVVAATSYIGPMAGAGGGDSGTGGGGVDTGGGSGTAGADGPQDGTATASSGMNDPMTAGPTDGSGGPGADEDDGGGCGCSSPAPRPGPWMMLGLGLGLGWVRRRADGPSAR